MVKQELRKPCLLVVAEFSGWLLQLFEQLFTIFAFNLCWDSCSRSIIGCLFDRFEEEPIETVVNRFLDDAVALSQRIQLIALHASNRRENTFSRLPFFCLVL
jgi:hypothetical protein